MHNYVCGFTYCEFHFHTGQADHETYMPDHGGNWTSIVWNASQWQWCAGEPYKSYKTAFKLTVRTSSISLYKHHVSLRKTKARFKRRILHAPNAIQTMHNEEAYLIIYCLNCIRCMQNSTFETGLNISGYVSFAWSYMGWIEAPTWVKQGPTCLTSKDIPISLFIYVELFE